MRNLCSFPTSARATLEFVNVAEMTHFHISTTNMASKQHIEPVVKL